MNARCLTATALVAAWMPFASAGEVSPAETASSDKSQYHLFHPVPRHLMRELSADRPDATESPYTVDAGHFQIEASVASYRRDRSSDEEVEAWSFGAFNLKAGLLKDVDIQFVFDSYTRERSDSGTVRGFSDVEVRLKLNLWGNDGGHTAMALLPFVKIPTDTVLSNGNVEGGLILPYAMDLSERVGLGLQAEVDFFEAGNGYEAEFSHTVVLGLEVTERFGVYLEYIGAVTSEPGAEYRASASGGCTYAVNDDLLLDAGAVVGLNDAADDLAVFSGFTMRF